jgi:heme-degrading monooxygenase HmoA
MIGVLVTFRFEHGFDSDRLIQIAEGARHRFEGMPGLRSKTFTLNEEQREAINFYVWDSVKAADRFFTESTLKSIGELYGVQPTLTYVNILARVENTSVVSHA